MTKSKEMEAEIAVFWVTSYYFFCDLLEENHFLSYVSTFLKSGDEKDDASEIGT